MRRWAVAAFLLALLMACGGTAQPAAIPTPDPAPTQTRAAGLAQPAVLNTPTPILTATPTVAPAPFTPTAIANDLRGYMASFTDGHIFVEWTEAGGNLSGTLQTAQAKPGTQDGIATESAGFTGIRSGDRVTLTIPTGLGFSTTWSGTTDGATLTLFIPDARGVTTPRTFAPASLTDYNRAVEAFRQREAQRVTQARAFQATATAQAQASQATTTAQARASQATAAAQEKQQAAVRDGNAAVARALRRLSDDSDRLKRNTNYGSVLKAYATAWEKMQADYQKVVDGAAKKPLSCVQLGQVQVAFGQVEVDYGSIQVARSSLSVVVTTVDSDIAAVREDIRAVQAAFSALQSAAAANTTGSPPAQFTAADVERAVTAANDAITTAQSATQQARDQAGDIDTKAARLVNDGKAFVSGLTCTN